MANEIWNELEKFDQLIMEIIYGGPWFQFIVQIARDSSQPFIFHIDDVHLTKFFSRASYLTHHEK